MWPNFAESVCVSGQILDSTLSRDIENLEIKSNRTNEKLLKTRLFHEAHYVQLILPYPIAKIYVEPYTKNECPYSYS